MKFRVFSSSENEIEVDTYNRNGVARHIHDSLNLLVNIKRFVRIGNTIEMSYTTKDSQNIKKENFHIISPIGGYPEGIVYVIK